MPVENFLKYKGECYDVGTVLKFRVRGMMHFATLQPKIGIIEKFEENTCFIKDDFSRIYTIPTISQSQINDNEYIIEIIEPVYYNPPEQIQLVNNRNVPPAWDVEIGWIWYIIIMIVGTIFNDRLLIWIVASVVFFLWKAGKIGGKK